MNPHIFLIDDDDDEHQIFLEAISMLDEPYDCTYASTAKNAIQFLSSVVPDFIFLDINMPGTSGLDLLAKIRQIENQSDTYIVMYSNGINKDSCQEAVSRGANTCIRKTYTVEELAVVLDDLIKMNWDYNNVSV